MPTKLKQSRSQHNGFGHKFQPVNYPALMPNQHNCETIHEVSSNEYFGDKDGFSFEELRWKNCQSLKKSGGDLDWTSSMQKPNTNRVLGEVVRNNSDTKLTENRSFCFENLNTRQLWSNSSMPTSTNLVAPVKLYPPSSESKEVNAKQFEWIIPREVKKRSILTVNEPSTLPPSTTLFTNRTWFLTENISNQFGFQPTFYGVAPVFEEGNFYAELFQYPTVPPKTDTKPVNLRTKKNFKQIFSPYSRNGKNVF